MSKKLNQLLEESQERLVVITRIFDAPRELVFKAWTDPEHLANWYAPDGCTIHFQKINMRQGGDFHSCIRTADGYECWCKGIYLVIASPERIVYSMANVDQQGNPIDPVSIGMDPEWPAETIVTVTFTECEGKTKLTLHQTVLESVAKRTGAYPSWLQMLDRLDDRLSETTIPKQEMFSWIK